MGFRAFSLLIGALVLLGAIAAVPAGALVLNLRTTPLAYHLIVPIGVMAGSILIGVALISGNRRSASRSKLHGYYEALEKRLAERVPANPATDEFDQYVVRINHDVMDAADWIGANMGGAARARFLDTTGMLAGDVEGAINRRHTNIILSLRRYRENLRAMIESGA